MKYVIIGNSAAAVGCVEGIREYDKKSEITIVSDEKYHTYSRPLISYLLEDRTDKEKMKYRDDGFYKENNVKTILGESVEKIDSKNKTVKLSSGKVLSYDKLMVAVGSSPFVPPMKGLEKVKNKTCFMTLSDAENLEKMIGKKKDKTVLIIGAGLIGLKCAEGIADKVKHITVCDLAERILPNVLDEDSADIVKSHIEKQNIDIVLKTTVESFSENEAVLTNGKKAKFDILVTAVGVRPNVGLVKDEGGKINRGILIDDHCRTSIKDIYTGGDCAEGIDASTGEHKIIAILPNAYMQGKCAGENMAGSDSTLKPMIPMNAAAFFGLHIITAGSYDGEAFVKEENDSYKKLVVKDGCLVGFILLGDVMRAGIYTEMIRSKTPLDAVDFELIREHPQMMAFSRVKRDEIFRRG